MLGETHVLQHHDTAQQEGSGVSETLAGNIGSRTVHGLEDGAFVSNVSRGSKTKTTDKTSAHIGQNVTVKVRHDKNLVVVWLRVGDHSQAGVVEELSIKFNIGEFLSNFTGCVEEETIGHLHDGSLVYDANLVLA